VPFSWTLMFAEPPTGGDVVTPNRSASVDRSVGFQSARIAMAPRWSVPIEPLAVSAS